MESFWEGLLDSLRWMNALLYVLLVGSFIACLAVGSWGERGKREKGEKGGASGLLNQG